MSDLEQQFREDRALRNSALALLKADVTHLKTSLSGKGLAERTVSRITTGAKDTLDQASEKAGDKVGILAALIGAIALWFAREPILDAFLEETSDEDTSEPDDAEVKDSDTEALEAAEIELTQPEEAIPEADPDIGKAPGDDHE